MSIEIYPSQQSKFLICADDRPYLFVPPYTKGSIIPVNVDISKKADMPAWFETWEHAQSFCHYQAAQQASVIIYPLLIRSVTDTTNFKSREKIHKLFLKNVKKALRDESAGSKTASEVMVLRLVFGEPEVSRKALIKNHSWMEASSDENVHQILIEAGHEPFPYQKWKEIIWQEVEMSWLQQRRFEDVFHWCMFAMLYSNFEFSEDGKTALTELYNYAFKEHQKVMYLESGAHKAKPWQQKRKTGR